VPSESPPSVYQLAHPPKNVRPQVYCPYQRLPRSIVSLCGWYGWWPCHPGRFGAPSSSSRCECIATDGSKGTAQATLVAGSMGDATGSVDTSSPLTIAIVEVAQVRCCPLAWFVVPVPWLTLCGDDNGRWCMGSNRKPLSPCPPNSRDSCSCWKDLGASSVYMLGNQTVYGWLSDVWPSFFNTQLTAGLVGMARMRRGLFHFSWKHARVRACARESFSLAPVWLQWSRA